jgi:hypothetical protein
MHLHSVTSQTATATATATPPPATTQSSNRRLLSVLCKGKAKASVSDEIDILLQPAAASEPIKPLILPVIQKAHDTVVNNLTNKLVDAKEKAAFEMSVAKSVLVDYKQQLEDERFLSVKTQERLVSVEMDLLQ